MNFIPKHRRSQLKPLLLIQHTANLVWKTNFRKKELSKNEDLTIQFYSSGYDSGLVIGSCIMFHLSTVVINGIYRLIM